MHPVHIVEQSCAVALSVYIEKTIRNMRGFGEEVVVNETAVKEHREMLVIQSSDPYHILKARTTSHLAEDDEELKTNACK